MTKSEAIKALKAMEREAGIFGVGEIENIGEMDKATAMQVYGDLIVKDEDMGAEIARRQDEEKILFGDARTADEIKADIVRKNTEYAAIIANAPETAEENYRVVC